MNLIQRKAQITDLKAIVALLADDKLGHSREQSSNDLSQQYIDAFNAINKDTNQYLIVLCIGTLMPSPTFTGSTRMQIETVRVHSDARGQNIGQQVMELAMNWGKEHGAKIFQLTTNKEKPEYRLTTFLDKHNASRAILS